LHIDGIEENLESPQLCRIRCLAGRWGHNTPIKVQRDRIDHE